VRLDHLLSKEHNTWPRSSAVPGGCQGSRLVSFSQARVLWAGLLTSGALASHIGLRAGPVSTVQHPSSGGGRGTRYRARGEVWSHCWVLRKRAALVSVWVRGCRCSSRAFRRLLPGWWGFSGVRGRFCRHTVSRLWVWFWWAGGGVGWCPFVF
jgi:hypothetical protein